MALTYYVIQDGADFYVRLDPESEKPFMTRTAPFPVRDGDFNAAQLARKWFIDLGTVHAQQNTRFANAAGEYES